MQIQKSYIHLVEAMGVTFKKCEKIKDKKCTDGKLIEETKELTGRREALHMLEKLTPSKSGASRGAENCKQRYSVCFVFFWASIVSV